MDYRIRSYGFIYMACPTNWGYFCCVVSITLREFLDTHERFFRLKATISLVKSFSRNLIVSLPFYGDCHAAYQYERLSNLCFACGLLDHTLKGCDGVQGELSVEQTTKLPYGVYMHVYGNHWLLLSFVMFSQFMETTLISTNDESNPKTDEVVTCNNHVTVDTPCPSQLQLVIYNKNLPMVYMVFLWNVLGILFRRIFDAFRLVC